MYLISLFFDSSFSMPDCREAIFLYTIFSFSAIGFEEIFTVWASTKPHYGKKINKFVHENFNKESLL